jgi:chromosome partitioning protein
MYPQDSRAPRASRADPARRAEPIIPDAMTIAVSSLKGGVGKSTLALSVATCLHSAKYKAIVVDVDPQGTCRAFASRAADANSPGPPVVALDAKALRRDLERIVQGFQIVLIDCPPRMGAETRAAMLASDLVICPTVPGAADVWALQETLDVFADAKSIREDLAAAVMVNRAKRTTLTTLTLGALAELDVHVLGASLHDRVAFGEAMLAGQGVVDYAPSGAAAFEVRRVTKAILAHAARAVKARTKS